jgi:E3 ubiquitin-protein ligase SHPRH
LQTTLIVTPQSLLKQWVAEMRTHAPHLRVCVYEGWRTLQRGVERQKAAANRSINAKIEAKRKRQSESLRRSTVRKYSRTNGGARVKIESDDEDEDEGEGEDEDEDEDEGDDVKTGHESLLEVTQRQFVEYVWAHDVVITTYK